MAVVWRKEYPDGGIVEIVDDAYRDISPEEMQARWDQLAETISILLGAECKILK